MTTAQIAARLDELGEPVMAACVLGLGTAAAHADQLEAVLAAVDRDRLDLLDALRPFARFYAQLGEGNISRDCVDDYRRAAEAVRRIEAPKAGG